MLSTPDKSTLPRLIDPRKFAQQRLSLDGTIALSDMPRLSDLALEGGRQADVHLDFDLDEQKHRVITGSVKCIVPVTCQRCLNAVDITLKADVNLAIVWNEEKAKQLPRSLEPLILDEGQTDLYSIIEDELLINVPMVSYHEENCISVTSFGEEEVEAEAEPKENPFQVLEQLKSSPKS